MSELFNIPETLSPRLAWMKEHGMELLPGYNHDDQEDIFGVFMSGKLIGEGLTEDDAITNAAKKLGLKLWNESEEKP